MRLNPFSFLTKPHRSDPLGFVLKPRRNPVASGIELLAHPLDSKAWLGICIALSFIPITIGYATTHNLSVSVAQSSTQIILILICVLIVVTGQVSFGFDAKLAMLVAICVGALQIAGVAHSPSDQKNYVMPSALPLFLMTGPIAISFGRKLRIEQSGQYVSKVASFLLGFFSIECVTRFAFSPFVRARLDVYSFGASDPNTDGFYLYKQSVFFPDSNSTGMALLCVIAVLLTFRGFVSSRQLVLAYFLLFATLSRASLIAGILQFVIYKFWRWRRWILAVITLSSPLIAYSLFTSYIESGFESFQNIDGSFASKLLILDRMVEFYNEMDLGHRLLGIGAGNTQSLIGIAAHNIIATFVLEFGLLGSVLIVIYVLVLSKRSPVAIFLLVVPIVVNGFSLILPSMPYFYVTLGLLGAVTAVAPWQRGEINQIPHAKPQFTC